MSVSFGFNNPEFSDRVLYIVRKGKTHSLSSDNNDDDEPQSKKSKLLNVLSEDESCIKQIHVNTMWLAAQSSMFLTMYSIEMAENQQKYLKIVVANEQEANIFVLCLKLIYGFEIPSDPQLLFDILLMANQYQFTHSIPTICSKLCDCKIELEMAYKILHMPDSIKFEHEKTDEFGELLDKVAGIIAKHFSPIEKFMQASEFLELSSTSVVACLESPLLKVGSQNSVYVAAKLWLTQNEKTADTDCIEKLFKCIRLSYCSQLFLVEQVANDSFFVDMYQKKLTNVEQPTSTNHASSPACSSYYAVEKHNNSFSILFEKTIKEAFSFHCKAIKNTTPSFRCLPAEECKKINCIGLTIPAVRDMPQIIESSVFYLCGYPFILEASKCHRDGEIVFSLFLFSKAVLAQTNFKVIRKFDVYDQTKSEWVCLNETTSSYTKSPTGMGMYNLFRKPFETAFANGSPYVNPEDGSLKLRAQLEMIF